MPFKTFPSRILGVDPGTQILGYAVVDWKDNQLKLLTMGTLQLKKVGEQQEKLKEIFLQLQEIIESYKPASMAIEAPFYGKNVQSMLKLGRAQGVAIASGITMGLEICEYSPKKIKQAITGNGNAAKEQVAAMLSHVLKTPIQAKYFDATDALACAVCHHQNGNLTTGLSSVKGQKFNSWKSFVTTNTDRVKTK